MRTFKVAFVQVEAIEVTLITVDKQYIGQDEQLTKYFYAFKKYTERDHIVLFMVDELQRPAYFGMREDVELIREMNWREMPWEDFTINAP